jgi:poly(3-hydroxybutyrate) depolymerase
MRKLHAIFVLAGMCATVEACAGTQGDEPGGETLGMAGSPVATAGIGGSAAPMAGASGGASLPISGTSGGAGAGAGGAGTGTVVPMAGSSASAGSTGGAGTAGSAGPPPVTGPCTGKTGAPGTHQRMVTVGGFPRTFKLHVPADLDPNTPAPVLLVFHGFTMSGQLMEDITGFDAVADAEKFVVAYPDGGAGAPWNVGQNICGVGAAVAGIDDDFGFVDAMLAQIAEAQCVDDEHVFVTGFSMGGYFSNHIGCQQGGSKIRAVAPHSGGTYPGDCPGAPLPVMILHGTADALITPDCGTGARDLWVRRNGCSTEFDMRPAMGGRCEWYKDCAPGGQVVLCTFDGMAHGWAGASQTDANGFYGGGTEFASATQLVWDFFKAQF